MRQSSFEGEGPLGLEDGSRGEGVDSPRLCVRVCLCVACERSNPV